MMELVFLLEEPSAKAMLESLLPRLLKEDIQYRCVPFEGKQDLEKQLTRKLRGYQNEQARFIVLRDQDSHPDCTAVKDKLRDLCAQSGRADRCLVRIACRELETFYLADLKAVEQALAIEGLATKQLRRKFRAPDRLSSPSKELKALTNQRYEKIVGSRAIGQYLDIDNDRSSSFRTLIAGIRRMEHELLESEA
ncbi:MAG: hypothetical protein AW11_02598 [Candidatus Accumulibacter regalis]|jgi:hypothetical protein|uniref:DUF4276 family protein n=1 Tax=Accumulibacter regalis TaxID=522306 RepID=A0A011R8M3_ACCRE|nr:MULTISPECIES: DUF4276 family protein [unclassified Candidatus Accumulibacter]EXI87469.1 MAG: hypothetical protein AW11_02598 [Candidatus Accumulibacter regalis]MBL8368004.1 DUF4276 family protein [Accumulibacter sp.]HRE70822.1 DUF4276 family protein [Accumulibacter sp.]HRE85922.1 DUF4276 family protein [Accumulibacter sp.]